MWKRVFVSAAFFYPLALSVATVADEQTTPPAKAQSLPPIECPLRKAGIDPTKLKPFEEVEDYIQFLERPDRAKWQKPEAVVKALSLKGTETVADVGAGSGYFTFRLSKALPDGRVIAIDSQPEMVRHVHRKARTEGFTNVMAQVATSENPRLPSDVDLVFVCDVLMHVKNRAAWLKKLHEQMEPGSRLVLIDFKEGELPEGPPESIKVPKARILQLCKDVGFHSLVERDDLLPYQQFLVFRRL